jgi:hypothetical protein
MGLARRLYALPAVIAEQRIERSKTGKMIAAEQRMQH